MICVECSTQVSSLYTYYSEDNINVTKCSNCGLFVDKYLEGEAILVAIDLLLLRPAAVRHVVFNSTAENTVECAPGSANSFAAVSRGGSKHPSKEPVSAGPETILLERICDPAEWHAMLPRWSSSKWGIPVQVLRLIVLALLFDVYQQWAMCEKSSYPLVQKFITIKSPALQYGMFLTLCTVDTFLMHFTVRKMASFMFQWSNGGAISTALLLGSFSKLLPILTFIWHYDMPFVAHIVRYAALFCVVEVLTIILGRGYLRSIALTSTGVCVSMVVNQVFWLIVETLV